MISGSVSLRKPYVVRYTDRFSGQFREIYDLASGYSDYGSQSSTTGNFIDPNNYSYETRYLDGPILDFVGDVPGYISQGPGVLSGYYGDGSSALNFVDSDLRTSLTNDAYNNALDKLIQQIRGSLDLSIDAAEARQVPLMLNQQQNVNNLAKTLSQRFGPLKLASGLWLQYTYAWKPLVSSVYETALTIMENPTVRVDRFRSQAKSVIPRGTQFYIPLADNLVKAALPCEGAIKTRFQLELNGAGTTELNRFTSLNPVSILWETLPYSFVVDWFYDVGGYLRALETSLLYDSKFRRGYTSTLEHIDSSLEAKVLSGSYAGGNLSGNFKLRRFTRSKLNGFPSPRPPVAKIDLGSSRLFSAAALLSNFLGRR